MAWMVTRAKTVSLYNLDRVCLVARARDFISGYSDKVLYKESQCFLV